MNVFLVAAGKGGCGKSTTTMMLARCLSKTHRVAVLDLDTSGPNLPKMMGIDDLSPLVDMDYFYPKVGLGNVQVMSPAFLIPPDMACAWSGDKRMNLINELLVKTRWADHDIMLCDCPPGTGDEIVAVLESVAVDGVILVTTAKEESIDDAKRAVSLFGSDKFKTPIICAVESMSFMKTDDGFIPLFTDGVSIGDEIDVSPVVKIPYDINLSPDDYREIADTVINVVDGEVDNND